MSTPVPPPEDDPGGTPVTLPVALTDGGPVEHEVYAELFLPEGDVPTAVQVLVPGFTYDHRYFTVPGDYNYTTAMTKAGWAVLALDRIGTGRSSRPPSDQVTAASNGYVLHQVVQALRAGTFGHEFATVVAVGHSYGSGVVLVEDAAHHDLDGLVLTGMLHTTAPLHAKAIDLFHQASQDELLTDRGPWPENYATHKPGNRSRLLEAPGKVEAPVSAYNEAIKGTATLGEGMTLTETYAPELSRAVKVPTLIVVGALDQLFSGGEDTSTDTVLERERACYGEAAQLEIVVIPDTGHALTIHPSAPEYFAATVEWAARMVPGAAK
jgi:pimeloyl-ACP methyl ester carboxylesterase